MGPGFRRAPGRINGSTAVSPRNDRSGLPCAGAIPPGSALGSVAEPTKWADAMAGMDRITEILKREGISTLFLVSNDGRSSRPRWGGMRPCICRRAGRRPHGRWLRPASPRAKPARRLRDHRAGAETPRRIASSTVVERRSWLLARCWPSARDAQMFPLSIRPAPKCHGPQQFVAGVAARAHMPAMRRAFNALRTPPRSVLSRCRPM